MNLGILVLSTPHSPFPQAKLWSGRVELSQSEGEFSGRLSDPGVKISCVLIGHKYLTPELVRVLKVLRLKRPLLPAFAQADLETSVDPVIVQRLTLKGLLTDDTSLEEVEKKLRARAFTAQGVARDAAILTPIELDVKKTDQEFFPVLLRDLFADQKTSFDVYVRLAKDKYVKFINKGDFASLLLIKKYQEKGIKNVYLLREQQNKFLSYCDSVTEGLIKDSGISLAVKSQQVMQFGDQILRSFESNGVTRDNLVFAREFLKRGLDNLRPLSFKSKEAELLVQAALEDYEHSTAMCILGGMLVKVLGYVSLENVNMISIALMLHDLGLFELPKHLRKHSVVTMSDAERALYESHPRLGVEKILKTTDVPEIVLQAILFHHERRDRSGYPKQKSGSSLNFVAEVIGICDDYLAYLEHRGSHAEFIKALDAEFRPKFSPVLIQAFKDIF